MYHDIEYLNMLKRCCQLEHLRKNAEFYLMEMIGAR